MSANSTLNVIALAKKKKKWLNRGMKDMQARSMEAVKVHDEACKLMVIGINSKEHDKDASRCARAVKKYVVITITLAAYIGAGVAFYCNVETVPCEDDPFEECSWTFIDVRPSLLPPMLRAYAQERARHWRMPPPHTFLAVPFCLPAGPLLCYRRDVHRWLWGSRAHIHPLAFGLCAVLADRRRVRVHIGRHCCG
eukprot:2515983-Prymnesium_polylepis.1